MDSQRGYLAEIPPPWIKTSAHIPPSDTTFVVLNQESQTSDQKRGGKKILAMSNVRSDVTVCKSPIWSVGP